LEDDDCCLEEAHVPIGEGSKLKQAEFAGQTFESVTGRCRGGDQRQADYIGGAAHQIEDGLDRARI
jgi:hypothetical protein